MRRFCILSGVVLIVSLSVVNCSESEVTSPDNGGSEPTVNITSPSDGESFVEGTNITFKGSGEDFEGNALPDSMLVWTSDKDGFIGSGSTVTTSDLSVNKHVITLTGSDIHGNTGSDNISITVYSSSGVDLVWIPAGTFTMGSPTDEPGRDSDETQHTVTLTNGFYMSKYEVTEKLWYEVMGGTPTTSQLPKNYVSWDMAVEFCNALSVKEGYTPVYTINGPDGDVTWNRYANGYRLPTEAEWEYACRAGSETAFANGPITIIDCDQLDPVLDQIGWYCGNSGGNRHVVGQKAPNDWGLYDMHGNLWEWVWDGYLSNYEDFTSEDPVYDGGAGIPRVFRSGCYLNYAKLCRSANRSADNTAHTSVYLGFRVCRGIVAR